MSASTSDKITDTRNAARPNSARVSSGRSAGATTLVCDNLAGWPTASKVHFVTYQIDANSDPIAGTQLDCYGIVSGNQIGSMVVVDGTDTGNAINDVVEMLPTAAWGQDLADALTVAHNRDGTPKAGVTYPTPILTEPTIADFTNANHTHASTAQGGQIGIAGIDWSTFSLNIKSALNTSAPGLTNSSQDLASSGLSLSFTVSGTAYALVTVSLGISSTTDFEFRPQIRLGGSIVQSFVPAAAEGSSSNRQRVRGFSYLVTLSNGSNTLSAGVLLSASTSPLWTIGGGSIAAIVLGKVTA